MSLFFCHPDQFSSVIPTQAEGSLFVIEEMIKTVRKSWERDPSTSYDFARDDEWVSDFVRDKSFPNEA